MTAVGGGLPLMLGLFGAAALFAAEALGGIWAPMLLAFTVLVGTAAMPARRLIWLFYAPVILFGAYGLIVFRDAGLAVMLWLIAVVVASDVAGYFAGRTIGGPKFWPRLSPKKTWSGTVAGWLAAALVGIVALGRRRAAGRGRGVAAAGAGGATRRHRRKCGQAAAGGQGRLEPDPRAWRPDGPLRRAARRRAGAAGGGLRGAAGLP